MPDHHFQFAIGSERAEEFAAAIGAAPGRSGGDAPPTYAMALIGSKLFSLLSDLDIDPANDAVLHTSQRFAYQRQLRAGEIVDCRLSMTEPKEQLHGRTLQLTCDFTAADGTPVLTAATGLLTTHHSAKGTK
jgi:hypothetical protein